MYVLPNCLPVLFGSADNIADLVGGVPAKTYDSDDKDSNKDGPQTSQSYKDSQVLLRTYSNKDQV